MKLRELHEQSELTPRLGVQQVTLDQLRQLFAKYKVVIARYGEAYAGPSLSVLIDVPATITPQQAAAVTQKATDSEYVADVVKAGLETFPTFDSFVSSIFASYNKVDTVLVTRFVDFVASIAQQIEDEDTDGDFDE